MNVYSISEAWSRVDEKKGNTEKINLGPIEHQVRTTHNVSDILRDETAPCLWSVMTVSIAIQANIAKAIDEVNAFLRD